MNSEKLLEKLNKLYEEMNSEKNPLSILINGKWGIGKTYAYNQFKKAKRNNNYYISLFGINSLEELKESIIKEVLFPELKKLNSNNTLNVMGSYLKKVTKIIPVIGEEISKVANVIPNIRELTKVINIENLKFSEKSIICIDDIERVNEKIHFKELMGLFERLSKKTNIVIIGNIEELSENQKEVYETYREKVIDFEYKVDNLSDNVIKDAMKKYDWNIEANNKVIEIFKKFGKDNLRTLRLLNNFLLEQKMDHNWEDFSNKEKDYIVEASYYVIIETQLGVFNKKYQDEIHDGEYKEIKPFDYLLYIPNHLRSLVMHFDQYYQNNSKIDSLKRKVKEVSDIINYKKLLDKIDYSFTLSDDELKEIRSLIKETLGSNENIPFYECTIFFWYYHEISLNFNLTIEEVVIEKMKEIIRKERINSINMPSLTRLQLIYARDDRTNTSIIKIVSLLKEVWNETIDINNVLEEKNIDIIKVINERGEKLNITDEYKSYLKSFIENGVDKNELDYLNEFVRAIKSEDIHNFAKNIEYDSNNKWQVKRYNYLFKY